MSVALPRSRRVFVARNITRVHRNGRGNPLRPVADGIRRIYAVAAAGINSADPRPRDGTSRSSEAGGKSAMGRTAEAYRRAAPYVCETRAARMERPAGKSYPA